MTKVRRTQCSERAYANYAQRPKKKKFELGGHHLDGEDREFCLNAKKKRAEKVDGSFVTDGAVSSLERFTKLALDKLGDVA